MATNFELVVSYSGCTYTDLAYFHLQQLHAAGFTGVRFDVRADVLSDCLAAATNGSANRRHPAERAAEPTDSNTKENPLAEIMLAARQKFQMSIYHCFAGYGGRLGPDADRDFDDFVSSDEGCRSRVVKDDGSLGPAACVNAPLFRRQCMHHCSGLLQSVNVDGIWLASASVMECRCKHCTGRPKAGGDPASPTQLQDGATGVGSVGSPESEDGGDVSAEMALLDARRQAAMAADARRSGNKPLLSLQSLFAEFAALCKSNTRCILAAPLMQLSSKDFAAGGTRTHDQHGVARPLFSSEEFAQLAAARGITDLVIPVRFYAAEFDPNKAEDYSVAPSVVDTVTAALKALAPAMKTVEKKLKRQASVILDVQLDEMDVDHDDCFQMAEALAAFHKANPAAFNGVSLPCPWPPLPYDAAAERAAKLHRLVMVFAAGLSGHSMPQAPSAINDMSAEVETVDA